MSALLICDLESKCLSFRVFRVISVISVISGLSICIVTASARLLRAAGDLAFLVLGGDGHEYHRDHEDQASI